MFYRFKTELEKNHVLLASEKNKLQHISKELNSQKKLGFEYKQ